MRSKKRKLLKHELNLYQRIIGLYEKDPGRWLKQMGSRLLTDAMIKMIQIRGELES